MITPETLPVGSLVRVRGRRGPWRYLGDGWFAPKNAQVAVLRPTVAAWAAAGRIVDAKLPSVDDLVAAMLHQGSRVWLEAYDKQNRLYAALGQDGCWQRSEYVFTEQRITILKESP